MYYSSTETAPAPWVATSTAGVVCCARVLCRLQVMKLLLAAKEQSDTAGWRSFQGACQTLKLQRTRALGEARELEAAIDAAARAARLQTAEAELGAHRTVLCGSFTRDALLKYLMMREVAGRPLILPCGGTIRKR